MCSLSRQLTELNEDMLVVIDKRCEYVLLQDLNPIVIPDRGAVHKGDQSQKQDELHFFCWLWFSYAGSRSMTLYCKIEKVTLVNMCTDELVTNINNVNWINNVLIRGALWTINEWLLVAARKKSNPLLHHTPKTFPFILLLDTYLIATRDRQSDCKYNLDI